MNKIQPFITCVDYWPTQIPPEKLKTYKQIIAEGQITEPSIVYNTKTGATCVQYCSIVPHEWIKEEMMRRV